DAKPVWVENVAEDDRCPRASIAAKEGLHAAFGFPITIQHEVVGVIEFFSHEIQPPDEDLLRMMAIIGSQLGQFIVRKQMEESLAEERSEEHTSELQSRENLVCRLLLEKKRREVRVQR